MKKYNSYIYKYEFISNFKNYQLGKSQFITERIIRQCQFNFFYKKTFRWL